MTEQVLSVTHNQKRISGPLMDRIVIHMQVPRVEYQKLRDMHPAQIRKYCVLDKPCQLLMNAAIRQLHLTARAYHRVLKLSWMIADLAGSEVITQVHLAEALQYRPKLGLM